MHRASPDPPAVRAGLPGVGADGRIRRASQVCRSRQGDAAVGHRDDASVVLLLQMRGAPPPRLAQLTLRPQRLALSRSAFGQSVFVARAPTPLLKRSQAESIARQAPLIADPACRRSSPTDRPSRVGRSGSHAHSRPITRQSSSDEVSPRVDRAPPEPDRTHTRIRSRKSRHPTGTRTTCTKHVLATAYAIGLGYACVGQWVRVRPVMGVRASANGSDRAGPWVSVRRAMGERATANGWTRDGKPLDPRPVLGTSATANG